MWQEVRVHAGLAGLVDVSEASTRVWASGACAQRVLLATVLGIEGTVVGTQVWRVRAWLQQLRGHSTAVPQVLATPAPGRQ